MKNKLFVFIFLMTVFFLSSAQTAQADCISTNPHQGDLSRPGFNIKFGAYIYADSRIFRTNCDLVQTKISSGESLTGEIYQSGQTSVSTTTPYFNYGDAPVISRHNATASISEFSVSASVYRFFSEHAKGGVRSTLADLVLVENPSGNISDVTNIPFKYCSELKSNIDGGGTMLAGENRSHLNVVGFLNSYESETRAGRIFFDVNDSGNSHIRHASVGKICRTGHIRMFGKYETLSIGLFTRALGSTGTELYQFPSGIAANFKIHDGEIKADFSWELPEGFKCYSASGKFPGCSGPKPQKTPNGCETSTGNPINFSLGFKHQTESDYLSGVLSFKRYYRSDADWYANSVGQRWRHNYDRFIIVTGNRATVTNEAGLVHTFEDDGSGNWKPIAEDNDLTATLESIPTGYLYTTPSDTREYYNTDGRLIRIEFRGGESLNLTYDALNRLSSVNDESSRSLDFSYNGSDKPIISMSTPDGVYSYSYGLNNNLTSVTKPDSNTRTYHYEDRNFISALTGITDENGVRYAIYRYDDQGRAISSEHAGGVNNFTVTYNADDSVTTTNPLGKRTTYHFENILGVRKVVKVEGHQSTHCAAANKINIYDERGFLKYKTDWLGNLTSYIRDERGLVISMTEAAGSNSQRTTSYYYDSVYRLPETIVETGKVTNYQYDSEGRTISESVTDTNTGETRSTTYSYHPNSVDAFGNVILGRLASIDGPRTDVNDITTFEYDSQLNLTRITNALGHETEMLQFDATGRPTLIKDSNDVETKMIYDAQGRLMQAVQGSNNAIQAATNNVYDDKGQLVKTIAPSGTFLSYTYDDAGRLVRIENSDSEILYTLDNADNRLREVYKDSAGVVRYQYNQVFDELSRVIRGIDDNGDDTSYTYDVNGNVLNSTDGNANITRFSYDALDRLTRTMDALGGHTVNTIDERDQLTQIRNPRHNTTNYVYNAFGDLVREISPDTWETVHTVDAAGNIVRRVDGRGVITRYSYDALNRLTNIVYPSDPSLNVVLVYDSGSGCGHSTGRLCEIRDASGTTQYSYDALGRLTQVIETRGALNFTTSYTYDLSGNVTGITLPSGRTITYGLDGNGQISNVNTDMGGTDTILADAITYLPFGGIEGLTYGNGITLTNTYNTAYQLTSRHIGSLINDNYSYDAAGNIIVKGTASYGYDPLYRLLRENSNAGIFDFSYDAIGNRLTGSKNGSSASYIYPPDSSRLSAINATPVTYDAAGNIITDVQRSYTIDAAGRVQDVSVSGATAGSYVYNANNQRTGKTVNGSTTHYVYGLGGQLYGEYDANGNLIREYVYLNGEPLAQVDAGGDFAYLHTDHLGTPRVATDSNAAQVWGWQSDAFGNGTPTGNTTVNLRFAGQYYDAESGLHYNWNRYYDPKTGRYITSDPIGLDGGLNTYVYVNANPVIFVDPLGLAYFAKRPLTGWPWMGLASCNPIDDLFNTEISHEQLFFEDGKSPSNIGFFDDGTLKFEPNPTGYRCRSQKYNDCIIRKAVDNVGPLPSYCLIGQNCQTWAERVREEYARLVQDPKIHEECQECIQ